MTLPRLVDATLAFLSLSHREFEGGAETTHARPYQPYWLLVFLLGKPDTVCKIQTVFVVISMAILIFIRVKLQV